VKVLTVLGTRPEIIRLSRIVEKLDRLCEHRLVHTGQNFDPRLSDVFFQELNVRSPDHYLGVTGDTFGAQVGQMLTAVDRVLREERPDALLILGDTNSGLCSLLAKRMNIPVYHLEAGNRCYDDRVPEEVNRRVIDHSSDVLMPYTERSRQNCCAKASRLSASMSSATRFMRSSGITRYRFKGHPSWPSWG
jgi:UDP-N-acetylglucosamine 2-epimerase (non-hydrolysing)